MKGLRLFFSNWRNLLPLGVVGTYILVAFFAPLLSPHNDPENPLPFKLVDSIDLNPLPPGPGAPLGTTVYYVAPVLLHYDIYHSLIWGTRDALRFGLVVALVSAALGVLVGAVGGYFGGFVNGFIMRVTDAFLAFPLIAGVWLFKQIIATYGRVITTYGLDAFVVPLTARQRFIAALGLEPVMLAFILFSWMPFARLTNANVLRLKKAEYIMAARTMGMKPLRIVLRHLLPNAITPAIVVLARDIGGLVILKAGFDFIGIGGSITEGIAEWSRLLLLGRTWIIGIGGNLLLYWWLYLPVTLALMLFGIGWNLLGDRLNVILNPRDVK
jgi:peptide/nickel transport system permease protein